MKRSYQQYSFSNRIELLEEIKKAPQSKDREYMNKAIKNSIQYLDYVKIYDFPNFVEVFKNNCFKSKPMRDIFVKYVKLNKTKFPWLSPRIISKANCCELNIILNRIMFQNGDEFIKYLIQNYPEDREQFEKFIIIKEIQTKISEGKNKVILQNCQQEEAISTIEKEINDIPLDSSNPISEALDPFDFDEFSDEYFPNFPDFTCGF